MCWFVKLLKFFAAMDENSGAGQLSGFQDHLDKSDIVECKCRFFRTSICEENIHRVAEKRV